MKFIRFLGFLLFLIPCVSFGATAEFQNASRLLSAARRGDTQTVQILISQGADINYTDSTGLSLVCTAVMNNDKRAIQVLQMYGADASNCERQIKKYKQKTRVAARGEEYGFFSGLSSSHIIALSALGVAAVVGGVALLTDVFDADNDNKSSSSSGGSHSGGGGGSSSDTTSYTKLLAQNLPTGPACNGTSCPTDFTTWENMQDFAYMSDTTTQDTFNYLMVARAYNAFVRGYLGMSTIRITSDLAPFDLSSFGYYPTGDVPGGGKPVNVAMLTSSGINATGSAVDGLIPWVDSSQITAVQTACANDSSSEACRNATIAATKTSHKYFNLSGTTVADATENTAFDLTGGNTVFGSATDSDTKLAKIIAGWEYGGRAVGDFYGFVPNGQLTVYKTGNGVGWTNPTGMAVTGSYDIAGTTLAIGDTFDLFEETLTVTSVSNGTFVATSGTKTYHGYIVNDKLYIDSNADNNINQMYVMGAENALTLTKVLGTVDYKNYAAIYNASQLKDSGNYVANVIANLSLPSGSANLEYATVGAAKVLNDAATTDALKKTTYKNLINTYYNLDTSDDTSVNRPGTDAELAFTSLGNYQQQILVNPAGYTKYGLGEGKSLTPQDATFENFAPVVYSGLQNLFATVVAVKPTNSTAGTTIDGYSAENAGKLQLSIWTDADNSDITYSSRMCGLTGNGNGGAMNPWCFAAPGTTDLDATAAMAGSIALVKSAFNYMTPKQVFLLLALTADGPYLGINPNSSDGYSKWTSNSDLISYLQSMYILPSNLDSSNAQYLESFKTAFGYGMINLERATRPGTNVYFYSSDTGTIVQSSGNAFWGKVATTSSSSSARASTVLGGRGTIRTAFYDVIESADGSISLPRVWNTEISLNNDYNYGLYMGDVLGEFAVDSTNKHSKTIGNMTFDMAMSPRAYNDNLNGLDNLKISFNNEHYDLNAEYQHRLTNGESRFNGRANGVLSLVSNAITSGAKYKYGKFAFGAHVFAGVMNNENLLENDPVVSSQFEPARLGLVNGGAMDATYNTGKFGFDVSIGNMRENNTVLGSINNGLLALNGADTQYIDLVANYKPFEKMKLFARATYANTHANIGDGMVSRISDLKSNAFALGLDLYGFDFTASMPLAVVDGKMGYDYADLSVVENNGSFNVVVNNPHIEYIDLSAKKRELRFSGSYKQSIGEFTDAGIGFIHRVNPGNTDAFGNESIFMFKIHHRLGI